MLTGQILLQLIVILVAVQIFGYLCKHIGQPWVIGEILAGLALGPSLLGLFLPGVKAFLFPATVLPTLQTLGDIGLVLYMFSLGARLDTHLMLRQSGKAGLSHRLAGTLPAADFGINARVLPLSQPWRAESHLALIRTPGRDGTGNHCVSCARTLPHREKYAGHEDRNARTDLRCRR